MITDLPVRPVILAPPPRIDRSPIQRPPVPAVSGSLRYECQIHSRKGFNEAAVQGVAKWKFRAGVRGGRKVNTQMRVPIVFRFDDPLDKGAP